MIPLKLKKIYSCPLTASYLGGESSFGWEPGKSWGQPGHRPGQAEHDQAEALCTLEEDHRGGREPAGEGRGTAETPGGEDEDGDVEEDVSEGDSFSGDQGGAGGELWEGGEDEGETCWEGAREVDIEEK